LTIIGRLLSIFRPRSKTSVSGSARFDAARTTPDNKNHWRWADGASSNAANSPEVRRVLRNRSRYEFDNNCYVNGLTGDRANETIGTGPRLQLILPESYFDPDFQRDIAIPQDAARVVERKFNEWMEAINLHDKLLVMDETETRDGEVFAMKFLNKSLPETMPQLDIRLYEADQVETPFVRDNNEVSGIEVDEQGNPTYYHVLRHHPGDWGYYGVAWGDYDRIPAAQMIHYYKPNRPGQSRGVPAFTSSLPLYAILRRWTLAGLLTAEAQSRINAVITQEHEMPGDAAVDGTDPAGDEIRFAGTHMMTLAAGQDAKTLPSSAPAPNYREVKTEILTETGRPINSPRNISSGSSHEYNYSSGRLDQQQWQRAIRIRRSRIERIILGPLFIEWYRLAGAINGYLPEGLPPMGVWEWEYQWDGFVSIDPDKDAKASTKRLENKTSTLKRECGERGEDWEEVQDQRLREELREKQRREQMGLPSSAPEPVPVPAGPVDEDDDEEADDE